MSFISAEEDLRLMGLEAIQIDFQSWQSKNKFLKSSIQSGESFNRETRPTQT